MNIYIDNSARVDKTARIGEGTKIWMNVQIRENAIIGKNCNLGKDVYIDHDVFIGDNCKIQNQVLIYSGTELEDNVFVGPQVCFANDKTPRAVFPDGKIKKSGEWKVGYIKVRTGASIGSGSILVPDIVVGKWALVGAGSVVTKNVPDYALVFGNPAKLRGYVCPCGGKLTQKINKDYICIECNQKTTIES